MASKKTDSKTVGSSTSSTAGAPKGRSSRKKTSKKTSANNSGGSEPQGAGSGVIFVEREIGGRTLRLETGRMAMLADGAVVARYGDTMVLSTAECGGDRTDIDFLPLTVDYRERAAAAGKFPGGFFKREGRPTTRETLTCRIIDRSIRPLFADGFRRETQVLTQVLCSDKENEADVLAAVGSFAALAISSIPNGKLLGACRIGLQDDKLVINPTWSVLQSSENRLNLTVAAHQDAIVMVEAGADQVSEEVMLEALELGHQICAEIAEMIEELVDLAGKEKIEVTPPERDQNLAKAVAKKFAKQLEAAPVGGGNKFARSAAMKAIKTEVRDAFPAPDGCDEKQAEAHKKFIGSLCKEHFKQGERNAILGGTRADGRATTTIRPITIEVGVLPQVHGSCLFTRGETQALCIATLGTELDRQFQDGIYPEDAKRWTLHYSFPPFSVGEVRRFLAPGRREIGHGALAERAISKILPEHEDFPYTLRVTSDIYMSNGSSSMASVCGGTLALMDAGVPIKQPVAGIAMGLVVEGDEIAILSDILGSEDGCGDMDFKVAGTGKGITALQMDIKCEGLTRETLQEAMEQAREGRLHILREMLKTMRRPREEISPNAPRLISIKVNPEKVGAIIGPGGRTIRALQEEFETRIAVGDQGAIEISGFDGKKVDACIERIQQMTADVEPGATYKGTVTGIKEFGCFVEILPGQEGLVHVSELANTFIRSVTDVVQVGDEIEVKVIDIDDFGKVKLSRRALLPAEDGDGAGAEDRPPARQREQRDQRPRERSRGYSSERSEGREFEGGRDRSRDRGSESGRDRPREGRGGSGRGREFEPDRPRSGDRHENEERGSRDPDRGGRDRAARDRDGGGRDRDDRGGRDRAARDRDGGGRDRGDQPRGRGFEDDRDLDEREDRGAGGPGRHPVRAGATSSDRDDNPKSPQASSSQEAAPHQAEFGFDPERQPPERSPEDRNLDEDRPPRRRRRR